MNEFEKEKLFELLLERASYGNSKENEKQLGDLFREFPELADDGSFDLTATAISLTAINADEPMPAHLKSQILANAEKHFSAIENAPERPKLASKSFKNAAAESQGFFDSPFWKWGGWGLAAVCALLALNFWLTRVPLSEIVKNPVPQPTLSVSPNSPEQLREQVSFAPDKMQGELTDFNPKQPKSIVGEVVWSNSQQKGFVHLRGLPVNDKTKETYQLWIFDAAQNAKTPVDGGVFDVDENGDVVIPITAKLKIQKPTMFAITVEKPGGVVVSDLSKVMTVAKV